MNRLWSPEQVLSNRKAADIIERQFPGLAPACVQGLGEGFDNSVFLVNDRYVFRFPRRKVAVSLIETENRLLPELAPLLPISIPNPQFFGEPDDVFPWPFSGYPKIAGKTPSDLSDAQRLKSAKLLAEFLRMLHDFPVRQAEQMKIPYDELDRVNIEKRKPLLESRAEEAVQHDLIPESTSESLQQFLRQTDDNLVDDTLVVAHGDLHIRNILVDGSGIVSGIIDWGDAHIGSPAVDLSIVYSFLPPEGRSYFFKCYGEVRTEIKTLARFKSIYTTMLLLHYGHDMGDLKLVKASQSALNRALTDEPF